MTYDKKMINRINRIQGQLNGVVKNDGRRKRLQRYNYAT